MGIQQFTTSLASFNQAQLDQIQANVTTVQTAVNDLKNTDVSQLSTKVDNLGWWGKYHPYVKFSSFLPAAANTLYDVINITGSGYLSQLPLGSGSGGTFTVQVIVDGVTVYDAQVVAGGTGQSGIYQLATIAPAAVSSGNLYAKNPGNPQTVAISAANLNTGYPLSVAANASLVLDKPIFYTQSFVIRAKCTVTGVTLYYDLIGGVK